jgi:hypothetical protein
MELIEIIKNELTFVATTTSAIKMEAVYFSQTLIITYRYESWFYLEA